MDYGNKSEKYRRLSITSLITGIIPCCYLLLLFYLFLPIISFIKDNFSSELTMLGLSIFKTLPFIAGFAIAAIVCGSIDLKRIKAGIYSRKGIGLDITGIVLGGFSIFLIAIWFILGKM